MTARITAAEARKFGLNVPVARIRIRRTATGPYASRCHDCGEAFTTQAAETRHLDATRHARYDLIIGGGT